MTEIDTAKIRAEHRSLESRGKELCHGCAQPWPCQSILLCDEVDRLRDGLSEVNTDNHQLEARVAQLEAEKADRQRYIEKLEAHLDSTMFKALEATLAKLEAKHDTAELALNRVRALNESSRWHGYGVPCEAIDKALGDKR